MSTRITNAMRTLLTSLGIDPSASTPPNLGSESDTAAATGSAFAQINDLQNKVGLPADTASATGSAFARANDLQNKVGLPADTASASGSLFARAKFNKDAADALDLRADAMSVDIGASTDTASASGSLFARAKFNKDAADALDLRAGAIEASLLDVQTITLDTVVPSDAVSVGGTTLTFVATDPGANEVLVGADDAESATNLAAAITALSGVSATADGAVVTVTADTVGRGVGVWPQDTTMVVASQTESNVMGLLHGLIVEINDLQNRVTAIEET